MGVEKLGFTDYELTTAKKQSKREKFLSQVEEVVAWQELIALMDPHYPEANTKGRRPPYPLAIPITRRRCPCAGNGPAREGQQATQLHYQIHCGIGPQLISPAQEQEA